MTPMARRISKERNGCNAAKSQKCGARNTATRDNSGGPSGGLPRIPKIPGKSRALRLVLHHTIMWSDELHLYTG